MLTWFCETFCCFLLRFHDRLRSQNEHPDAVNDDRLESGHSVFQPSAFRHHHNHQGSTPSPPRAIPMGPIYPGGPPPTAKRQKRSPPRTVPRAVPLPVRYPPSQTPTGKHFRHNKPVPDRMKPLPPLRGSFNDWDPGLRGGVPTTETFGEEKPPASGSCVGLRTPAPAYDSAALSGMQSVSPPLTRDAGGFLPVTEEVDKACQVKVSF
ncbi:MAG: hypothetical protein Q9216_006255 [Gyalolechia sp. 2 TL-2023]